ncbi:hypothetical protein [Halobellus sp. GM3]|uniref:hypothetical protein n=1 Tax=Halobellus sp. GM3 TaxID=3458410 RepID=UPI00403DE0F7
MNAKPIVIIALVVAVGVGAVVVGENITSGGDADESEPFPTATASDSAGNDDLDGSEGSGTATSDSSVDETPTPPFAFTIENIEECGQTCRDVTSTLTNQQDATAEGVTVHTRIFAGRGTDGDVIWNGDADVGTLAAGESFTTTRRVDLSFSEALKVQNNDGWITVQTTVDSADRTVTFTDERQVA